MTITDTLARDNGALDVNTGTHDSPVWTPVAGLNNWSPSPSKNSADTTKFSNGGWASHLPASRSLSMTFSGLKQVDPDTGDRDPGQAAVEALGLLMGPDGLGEFRHSMVGVVNVFTASVNATVGGGGNDDPDAWSVELEMSGSPTTTLDADVPAAVTAVTGTPGDDGDVSVTWTDGSPAGTLFEVQVFNGATLLKSVIGSDKPILVSGLGAGSGRTAKVRAQNAAGWSALSTASSSFTIA
jgi:hypothetical protein